MNTNAFVPLAILQIPSSNRLLTSSCCPDKDLVALISRLGGQNRLSLWNYTHGSKVWDVDVGGTDENAEIFDIAWSPDGQSIAVVHQPPQITLHSLQDGMMQFNLAIPQPGGSQESRAVGVWWFRHEGFTGTSSIPDIFKRNYVITGTTHSILQILPLLDALQQESQKPITPELFAFQGSQTRSTSKSLNLDIIDQWPTLSVSSLSASISPPLTGRSLDQYGGVENDIENANTNSILTVTDNLGNVYCFLDGSFPLGVIALGRNLSIKFLFKDPRLPMFFAHPCVSMGNLIVTSLRPIVVDIPLLETRKPRDLAKLSSTARELMQYIMGVVKEMYYLWFGSEAFSGVRELGPKWIEAIEAKQKNQFGQEEPNAILDLTTLLVTGRATDPLLDFLGSSEQMSERGIQKWESTMTEALMKLRDFSEKRIAPACQRLHLVLEELQGWSQLSHYALFELSTTETNNCIELTRKTIILVAWLAATARRDLSRFREFMMWLRFETSAANPTNDHTAQPRYDILEVNNYLTFGLLTSSVDKWFTGPLPQFSLQDLGVPESDNLTTVLKRARILANDPVQMSWGVNTEQKDLSFADRNIDALVNELAIQCKGIFVRAAGAACRSAVISSNHELVDPMSGIRHTPLATRERTTILNEGHERLQYLIIPLPSEESIFLCIARLHFNETLLEVSVVLFERVLPVDGEERLDDLDLLEAEFFDDEHIVMVYRLRKQRQLTYIATLNYSDSRYQVLQVDRYATLHSREDLMLEVIKQWKNGHLTSIRSQIKRVRALVSCKTGEVSLALNGRVGRRVACVLDSKGTTLESFDMEDDIESDGEA